MGDQNRHSAYPQGPYILEGNSDAVIKLPKPKGKVATGVSAKKQR